jgi:hypothetical protein
MSQSKARKRKSQQGPRRKRMKSEAHLASAKATDWVKNYSGKNIVRRYRKWFGVDFLQAIAELRKLGVSVSVECETQIRKTIEQRSLQKRKKKEEKQIPCPSEIFSDWDSEFEFVAGYTSCGAPYGIPRNWNEDEQI